MKLRFALHYALRSLRRSGRHTLLALACIAFGVMSLVALQLLTAMITTVLFTDPRAVLGGDVRLTRAGARTLTADDLVSLTARQEAGTLDGLTPFSATYAPMFRRAGSGRILFANRVFGVDPATFPQVGAVPLQAPPESDLATVLAQPLSAVVTRDLAASAELAVGDRIILGGSQGRAPQELTITGIATNLPDQRGGTLLYSLETARRMAGQDEVITSVAVRWGAQGDRTDELTAAGWDVETPAMVRAERERLGDLFAFMLKGAGLLGLLVGGIGVATTLQVTLARRTLEIATLKTLGYRRRDLLALFGIELVLLGTSGGAVGSVAAVGLAFPLMTLMQRTGNLLLAWQVDPAILLSGLLVGAVTALICGMHALFRAGAVRPAVLLRNLPLPRMWSLTLGLYGLLGLLFAAISSLILGSLVYGVGVVLFALVALGGLGLLLGLLCAGIVRLRLPGPRALTLARNNIRRQPLRVVMVLIALFAGVFSIGFTGATMLSARNEIVRHTGSNTGYNLALQGSPSDAPAIAAQLAEHNIADVHTSTVLPVSVATSDGTPVENLTVMQGRATNDALWDIELVAGEWNGAAKTALVPAAFSQAPWHWSPGTAVQVETTAGATITLTLAGFYEPRDIERLVRVENSLLVSDATLPALDATPAVNYEARVAPDRLDGVTTALGTALPQTLVVSRADLNARMAQAYTNLFAFVVAVAGLAFVAGAVLIANAVGLALVERRREMGILKAVGFSSGRVLSVMLLEYALLGLISGVAGIAVVVPAQAVINRLQPTAQLALAPQHGLALVGIAVVIALGSVLLVAWRPTHVYPLVVLREE